MKKVTESVSQPKKIYKFLRLKMKNPKKNLSFSI